MVGSRLNVHLFRDSFNTPWGFRLQGGTDLNQPLVVQRVFSNSPAEGELQRGDVILSINNKDGSQLTHKQAQDSIKHGGGQVDLVIERPPPGSGVAPLSPPIVTQLPRAPSLQESQTIPLSSSRPTQMSMYSRASNQGTPVNQPLHVDAAPPPDRGTRGYSQPPITPSTPPPPWAVQQPAPKRVARKSQLGGKGGLSFGTDYSTMPRSRSQSSAQYGRRPKPGEEVPEEQIVEPDRLATGPIPKVCSRSNLGGGNMHMGSSFAGDGSSATLPRRNTSRQTSQPRMASAGAPGHVPKMMKANNFGGGGPEFGTDFANQRVQSNLENMTLSPRTPEAPQGSPFHQPAPAPAPVYQQPPAPAPVYQQPPAPAPVYQPPPQQEPEFTTPTLLLLEQQRMADQQQEQALLAKGQQSNSIPTVLKPSAGVSKYADFGTDYRNPQNKQWRPAPQVYKPAPPPAAPKPAPAPAPVPAPQPAYQPQAAPPVVHQEAPPAWQKPPQVEDDSVPAWKTSLRSSGVKPWERELASQVQQEAPRSVPYNPPPQAPQAFSPAPAPLSPAPAAFSPAPAALSPAPAVFSPAPSAFSPAPVAPAPVEEPQVDHMGNPDAPSILPMPGMEEPKQAPPKVVHLQYNSPMGLYSDRNVEETLAGQTAAMMDQSKPNTPSTNPSGARDWSQSAVLQFIEAENQRVFTTPFFIEEPKKPIAPWNPDKLVKWIPHCTDLPSK